MSNEERPFIKRKEKESELISPERQTNPKTDDSSLFFNNKEKELGEPISQRIRQFVIFTKQNKPGKSLEDIWRMIYG